MSLSSTDPQAIRERIERINLEFIDRVTATTGRPPPQDVIGRMRWEDAQFMWQAVGRIDKGKSRVHPPEVYALRQANVEEYCRSKEAACSM